MFYLSKRVCVHRYIYKIVVYVCIRSKDPDKELNKLLKANEMMEHALSDAYTQKHFID